MYRFLACFSESDVDDFDEERERHREVDVAFRNVELEALGDELTPISSRKLKASILIVGCLSTKRLTAPAKRA